LAGTYIIPHAIIDVKRKGIMTKPVIFVYSIIRNEARYIDRYYDQLRAMVTALPEYEFILSIYENDSSDGTPQLIKNKDWSFFTDFEITSERLRTRDYGSVKLAQRVKNLSIARNKALAVKDFMKRADYVMMVESDMRFDVGTVRQILEFRKLEPDFDIVSGLTVNNHPVYDSWATRKSAEFTSHVEVRKYDFTSKPYDRYYATSNGICLYKAQAFRDGAKYGWMNEVTKEFDCDTVVVCQNFQKLGYDKIYILHTAKIYHEDF
jgi:GT2 family glycosyltransferase